MSQIKSEKHRYYAKVIEELKLVNSSEEINILLLGETGVGKSTFINALANYLTYGTLKEARDNDILALIPTSFTVTSEDYGKQTVVGIGSDENEQTSEPGQSATQQCKSFVFPFGERLIRLIDTPGVGDTRGVDQDSLNFDDILAYIGQFQVIHCICFLMKPNNPRVTVTFEYCIKQLLSHLQKSASHNIVFVFTNTRSFFYKPGDTAPALKTVLEKVKNSPPYVDIVFNKDTTFCLDNEPFRFLVAIKNGIDFDSQFQNFAESWDYSANQCRSLMQYIIGVKDGRPGLTPHKVKDTQSVNEARRVITLLTQPLAEITQNINENLYLMEVRKTKLDEIGNNIESLEKKLLIPYYDLEFIQLSFPATVCSAQKCCTSYNLSGNIRGIFKTCHSPCDTYGVRRDVLGDNRLKKCDIFKGWPTYSCRNCGCSYKQHLHVYYETRVIEKYREDEKMSDVIGQELDAHTMATKMIETTDNYIKELNYEMSVIIETRAKFTQFLQHNAIAPYNDTFTSYLEVMMEKTRTNQKLSPESVTRMKKLQEDYENAKQMLNTGNANEGFAQSITVDQVFEGIDNLYALKNYGNKIREMRESQESAGVSEISLGNREVRFEPDYKMPAPKPSGKSPISPIMEDQVQSQVVDNVLNRNLSVRERMKLFEK